MFHRKLPPLPLGLINAIKNDDLSNVQEYLDNGVNPNIRHHEDETYQGRPPLSYAAIHGHTKIMELLIKRGAEVDRRDLHGRTPLSWAAEHCQLEAAKLLVNHGAKINAEDKEWGTPLSWLTYAAPGGSKMDETRSYLVSQGAMESLDKNFWDHVSYAIASKWHWMIFKHKMKGADLDH